MENSVGYDKIKHLVEVEEHILAVFTMNTNGTMGNLNIAKDIDLDKNHIESIFSILQNSQDKVKIDNNGETIKQLGKIKWKIFEFERFRILQIFDRETVIVLIKANTSLNETVDNILGYYYEEENIPKSLF
ncbi:MAG: hypothetical protein MRJ93_12615 [Nitrososphaeraceae archaeon]|nr:hypothetical protein [Nitrososphaeraceae archaeon]